MLFINCKRIKHNVNYIILIAATVFLLASLIYTNSIRLKINNINGIPQKISDTINAFAFSKDGNIVYIGTRSGKIKALDSGNNTLWEFEAGGMILDLKTGGEFIYAGADDRKLYILDKSGKVSNEIEVGYRPMVISGSEDGKKIVTGTTLSAAKNRLQLYSCTGGEVYSNDPGTVVADVFMMNEGDQVIYITREAEIFKVDGKGVQISKSKIAYYPVDAVYNAGTHMLVVSDEANNVYAFDENLKQLWTTKADGKVNSVSVDSKADQIILALDNGCLDILDMEGVKKSRIASYQNINKLLYNEATDGLYLLLDSNVLVSYNASILLDFSREQSVLRVMTVICIVSGIFFVITLINVSPVLSGAIWGRLVKILKTIYRHKLSYLLILPTLLLLAVFNYYPIISGLVIAFTDYKPGIYMHWAGLNNFISMVNNPYFWVGVGNMFILLVTDLIKALIPPIIFAEMIIAMKSKKVQYWTRVILYIPGILPGIAGLLIWTNGILGMNGIVNGFLRAIGLGQWVMPWLGDGRTAIWALVFIGFPWIGAYIILYGALIGIPDSYFDAAKIDGCGWWRRIKSIDIPLIGPQLKYLFVVGFIASVQDFGRIYVTTAGGPGRSTYTPMLELFFNMSKFQNYGVASAMGLFLFIVIFAATLLNMKMKVSGDS